MNDTDDACVMRTREGDLDAFEILVARHEQKVLRYLRQYVGAGGEADDLLQETFLKAYRGLSRYRTGRSFTAWLFAIARNTAISHLRKRIPAPVQEDLDEIDHRRPDSALATREAKSRIWKQVRELLGERGHTALWLMYAEDMPVKEIAAAMNASAVSVKVLLHRSRRKLKAMLPEVVGDERVPSLSERILEGAQG